MNGQGLRIGRWRIGIAGAVAGALLAGVVIGWTASGSAAGAAGPAAVAAPAAPQQIQPGPVPAGRQDSYADVVARVAPAVVTVRAQRVAQTVAAAPLGNDLFDEFFGRRGRSLVPAQPREEGALGSGVIVSQDGYILTNHHVVERAARIEVELSDRRSFDAKLVGSDPPSDLAVLKIEANGLRSLHLGDSDTVRVGDVVLAIGNPLGLGQTVTMGIISAKGRATTAGDGSFEDFLQTDAPINQGNSGGALVDTRGELVGINSQIVSPSGGNIGIGFAIPAAMARNVMGQLVKNGAVRRAMIGVTVQGVTSDLAKSLGLRDVRGALVTAVEPDGPAQRAGIERGDVIVNFEGREVTDANALRNRVSSSQPGTKVALTVVRNGRQETKEAVLTELPTERVASNGRGSGAAGGGKYGLAVTPLTPDLAGELGVHARRGLVVEEVAPASAASEAGIQSGDVILEVNRQPVGSVQQFQEAMKGDGQRPALLLVSRQGHDLFLAMALRRG